MSEDGSEKRVDTSQQPENNSAEAEQPPLENAPGSAASEESAGTADQAAPSVEADPAAEMASEIAQLRDNLLRKQADFDNFRKRLNRDKEESVRFANQELLMDLGGVLDDFERAHAAVESRDFDALSQGVEMIEKQLSALLERKWGLVSFSSEGESFDPERHEAIAAEESAEAQDTTVLECYQKGYVLNGRVVRPARVRVRKPAGPPPGA